MAVAICIVGYCNPNDIQSLLVALAVSEYADFHVVICENGGPDAFEALRRTTPAQLAGGQTVQLVEAPGNLGYAGGINVCLRAAPAADAYWVLNPDTVPEPAALGRMVARLADGDCDAVGSTVHFASGRVESRGGRWRPWLARAESIDNGAALDAPPTDAGSSISYLSGASMLVSRAFVDRAGPMREEYFLYAEEVEWCLRARALGLRLAVAPDARVLHRQGSTTGSVPDIRQRGRLPVYLDERNKLLVTRDCYPERLPVAVLAALALLLLRFGRKRAWRQLGYAFSGWRDGVMNRRGRPAWS